MIRRFIPLLAVALSLQAGCGGPGNTPGNDQPSLSGQEAGGEMAGGPAPPALLERAGEDPDISIMVKAIEVSGLASTLAGPGPFTVLAPVNHAFAELPDGYLEALLLPENEARLRRIIGYHILPGKVMAGDIPPADAGLATATIAGLDLSVRTEADGAVWINQARLLEADRVSANGVIHVIDTVLLPRDSE